MELEHAFTVPVGVDRAWTVLRDVERIAPCMPGATIDSVDGDDFTGRVKVKVGPMQITYTGDASFTEVNDEEHRAVIEARGRETRGSGTARATILAQLEADGDDATRVEVVTDLTVTGKPAQFGRGVMADVGEKLIGRFADCLAAELGSDEGVGAEVDETGAAASAAEGAPGADGAATVAGGVVVGAPTAEPADAPEDTTGSGMPTDGELAGAGVRSRGGPDAPAADFTSRDMDDAIDLLDVARGPVLQRLGPAIVASVLLWLVVRWARRR